MEKKMKVSAMAVSIMFFLLGIGVISASQRMVVAEMQTNTS